MDAVKYAKVVECLGPPDEKAEVTVPIIGPIYTATNMINGTHQNGTFQYITIPQSGQYRLIARGASGSLGTYIRSGTTEFKSDPGHGAVVTTELLLNEGDELLIIVGQQGYNAHTTNSITDGAAGGSGGGTFVFRKIMVITDARYQIEIAGNNYECLLVAAGGGGTQDNCYKRSTANGYDAAEQLYSLSNFNSFSTATANPSISYNASSPLGLAHIRSYNATGAFYNRNGEHGYGGYGGGSCADDNFTYGGGWSTSNRRYRTASWARDGGTIEIAKDFGDGLFTITRVAPKNIFAWWTPVTDRVAADCIYGNSKGCIDSVLLNRLEADTEYITYLLDEHHLKVSELSTVDTVWHRKLYLLYGEMERIRSNIETIRNSGIIETSTPIPQEVKGCDKPGYVVINEWERILYDMYSILIGITMGRRPLGTFNCGFAYTEQKLYLGGE